MTYFAYVSAMHRYKEEGNAHIKRFARHFTSDWKTLDGDFSKTRERRADPPGEAPETPWK